jgi:hypothetical protein
VLDAVMRLHNDLLAKPEPIPQDCNDERWKWFKVNHFSINENVHVVTSYIIIIK